MPRLNVVLLGLVVSAVAARSGLAAQALSTTGADATLDKRAVVDSVASVVRARYVSADTGGLIADHLLARLHAGAYDTLSATSAFTRLVTLDMRAVNGDKHLSLTARPANTAPGQAQAPPPPVDFGFSRVEVMDGNVGYLRIASFVSPTPEALDALARAMNTLRNVDALIVDVRDNPGGNGAMNDYLWGYFVGHDTAKTMLMRRRGATAPVLRWTQPIDNPRPRAGIPVLILTSGGTGSAAEGFAFFLQQSGRARTVGEATAGAGHNVAFFNVDPGLAVGVSIGRVAYSGNDKEWERVGVRPDIPSTSASALSVALSAARQPRR